MMYSCALLITRPETPRSRVLEADVETYDKACVKIAGATLGGEPILLYHIQIYYYIIYKYTIILYTHILSDYIQIYYYII